jgi:uncharacterized protein YjbI with pentapeptide repeats
LFIDSENEYPTVSLILKIHQCLYDFCRFWKSDISGCILVFIAKKGKDMKNKRLRSNYKISDNAGIMFVIGPEADLTGADFRGMDLSYSDLAGATLRGADLTVADVSYCDFTSANFSPSEFAPVSLDWAVMIGSNFEFADLAQVSMVEAVASNANFFYACFESANLTGADLTNANLSYAQMERTDLRGAILENAEFDNATNFIGLTDEQWLRLGLLTMDELDIFYAALIEKQKHRRRTYGND